MGDGWVLRLGTLGLSYIVIIVIIIVIVIVIIIVIVNIVIIISPQEIPG